MHTVGSTRRVRGLAWLVATLALALPASGQDAPADAALQAFQAQVNQVSAFYDPIEKANVALLDAGKVAECTRRLLEAVPEAQRTTAHDFVLGNLLFDLDPATSLRFHQKASAADPGNVLIQEQWALQLHRAGRWEEAESMYAKVLAHPAFEHGALHALHAEVLLRLGRPDEAVAAWRKLDAGAQHTDIEEALGRVHAPRSPWVRRTDLLAKVGQKKPDIARDLILLDLHFDTNWWNARRRDDYLQADFARLDAAFGAKDRRLQELHAFVLLEQALPADPLAAGPGAKPDETRLQKATVELTRLELLGNNPRLAMDADIAERILTDYVRAGIVPWSQVAEVFKDTLQETSHSKAGDPRGLKTLCGIFEAAHSDDLADLDRYGWERYHDPSCAASLLAASLRSGKPDEALLAAALARFPDEASLLRLAVQFDEAAGRTSSVDRMTALLLACANDVPDAHQLAALYGKLDAALSAKK